ncbi:N-acyl-D-amino-acid deacylase family protein [Gimesia maris]|uniref:N-acyl-D-amino-acid deacylase family protein n=1 Tax=Gimesia maris TaxID=122 RepID=UPI0001540EA9|nr:D-aminoacylase [Gimesia maris]EDL59376.1 d-aminoacylase (aspartate, glutamate etc) [Gimesia maris DSM 8797]
MICLLTTEHGFSAERVDYVIENGTIHDGTGKVIEQGYVAVRNGKIVSVGPGEGPACEQRIDATCLVISPGFIDLHTHSDRGIIDPKSRGAVNYLLQGCTTSVTGNCGMGPIDVQEFYDNVDKAGAGTNVAHLLPQGELRSQVIGRVNRKATKAELQEMQRLAAKAMKEGAWGMSTGLIYTPSTYANTEELTELAKVIGANGGIYASHIRGEEEGLVSSIQEAIHIGQDAEVPVHVSHLKVKGTPNWGTLRLAIELIKEARKKGQRVTADQYPYIAASTSLAATIFPPWSMSGGVDQLVKRLDDPEAGAKVREAVGNSLSIKEDGKQIVIAQYSPRPDWVGKHLREIAKAEQKTALQIAEEIMRSGGAQIVNFAMNEEEVRDAMINPWVATASDGGVMVPDATRPHPRNYGAFPRKIGHYAIREQVIPLNQAIRSATGLPADVLGLTDRGYLKPGQAADIVIFDPKTIIDTATFENPHQYADGMRYVFVNGVAAVHEGTPTGALAGRALRKKSTP